MANRADYIHILELGDSDDAYDALFACPDLVSEMERDGLTACEMLDKLAARLFVGPPTKLFDLFSSVKRSKTMTYYFVNYKEDGFLTIDTFRNPAAEVTDIADIIEAIESDSSETLTASIDGLPELRELLNAAGSRLSPSNDLSALPTFGGTEPANTLEVYSWDKDNILAYSDGWRIQPRCPVCGEAQFHCHHD